MISIELEPGDRNTKNSTSLSQFDGRSFRFQISIITLNICHCSMIAECRIWLLAVVCFYFICQVSGIQRYLSVSLQGRSLYEMWLFLIAETTLTFNILVFIIYHNSQLLCHIWRPFQPWYTSYIFRKCFLSDKLPTGLSLLSYCCCIQGINTKIYRKILSKTKL